MATPEERAVSLKNEGNKAFAAHNWPAAIDLYTKAIELNDQEPTYFSNRAQVSLAPPCPQSQDRSQSARVTNCQRMTAGKHQV